MLECNKSQTHILHQIKFTSSDVKLSINYVAGWIKGTRDNLHIDSLGFFIKLQASKSMYQNWIQIVSMTSNYNTKWMAIKQKIVILIFCF